MNSATGIGVEALRSKTLLPQPGGGFDPWGKDPVAAYYTAAVVFGEQASTKSPAPASKNSGG